MERRSEMNGNKMMIMIVGLLITCHVCVGQSLPDFKKNRIKPFTENPRYRQYEGEPVLLIGGSKEDNLFQIPGLKEHLDLLVSVGGNYIRNTMSSRDEGNVFPFAKTGDKYDLKQWNEIYWERFENMLKWTQERDIILQLEVWAIWDMFSSRWEKSPWNPDMNINYTDQETSLKTAYDTPGTRPWKSGLKHDFYFSVPDLENDKVLLAYQKRFVDKILTHALNHGNVLYCITNEIFVRFSPEWGWYWAKYIKNKAQAQGKYVCVAEMYQWPAIRHEQHKASLDHPEIFDLRYFAKFREIRCG